MVRQEIWLASYLVQSRFGRFKTALKSFDYQSTKTKVMISVCGPEAWRAKKWAEELLTQVPHELFLYEERYSQFDQLYLILKASLAADPEGPVYVSVCDDDDYFTSDRIEVQDLYIDPEKSGAYRCGAKGINGCPTCRDFGCFCVNRRWYERFFSSEFQKEREEYVSIAPDILFMALLKATDVSEVLYIRANSLYGRSYNESREGSGEKWFTITLV